VATAYGQRPSAILGIYDPSTGSGCEWAAYQLDLATLRLGRQVEAALAEGKDVEEILSQDPPSPQPSQGMQSLSPSKGEGAGGQAQGLPLRNRGGGRFREPEAVQVIKVPESGIW
jgi:hypothetical protein